MFYIGVDLGKSRDFTAIAIVEEERVYRGLAVPWLETIPLGTPFTAVIERIEKIVWRVAGNCELAVDATGLGTPVVDALKESRQITCSVTPVVITGGERGSKGPGGVRRVPKRDLIGRLQLLFEKRQLRIAGKLKDTPRLVRELLDMRVETMAGEKEHDDLVMAVSLACWAACRGTIGYGEGKILSH
jgi:hypothetical protein